MEKWFLVRVVQNSTSNAGCWPIILWVLGVIGLLIVLPLLGATIDLSGVVGIILLVGFIISWLLG